MARKKHTNGQRDFSNTQSLDTLLSVQLRPPPVLIPLPAVAIGDLLPVEDRRTFQPDRSTRPPRSTRPGASRTVADPRSATRLRFADPAAVAICARRARRREVLFALRKTRKGSRSPKRRNFWSIVGC